MVCENQIVPFCFRDGGYILVPVEGFLERNGQCGADISRPCFREDMRCTVLVEELEFTEGIGISIIAGVLKKSECTPSSESEDPSVDEHKQKLGCSDCGAMAHRRTSVLTRSG